MGRVKKVKLGKIEKNNNMEAAVTLELTYILVDVDGETIMEINKLNQVWCFVTAFGRELAQKLLCQPDKSCGAGTGYSLGYYKAKGRFFTAPQIVGAAVQCC